MHTELSRPLIPNILRIYEQLAYDLSLHGDRRPIWMVGMPGSGKSTLANVLTHHFGADRTFLFRTGDMARSMFSKNSLTAIDDAINTRIRQLLAMRRSHPEYFVIIDSGPRSIEQVNIIKSHETRLVIVRCPDDVRNERMVARGRVETDPTPPDVYSKMWAMNHITAAYVDSITGEYNIAGPERRLAVQ